MNLSQLTREQRLLAAAGACALFVISLFLPWFGGLGLSTSAADAGGVPAWWVLLLFALGAGALLAAEALGVQVPVVRPVAAATYLLSVVLVVTLMFFLDTPGEKRYGIFLALIFAAAALAVAGLAWRRDR